MCYQLCKPTPQHPTHQPPFTWQMRGINHFHHHHHHDTRMRAHTHTHTRIRSTLKPDTYVHTTFSLLISHLPLFKVLAVVCKIYLCMYLYSMLCIGRIWNVVICILFLKDLFINFQNGKDISKCRCREFKTKKQTNNWLKLKTTGEYTWISASWETAVLFILFFLYTYTEILNDGVHYRRASSYWWSLF